MEIEVHIVNAFTKDGQGGNPAAIIFNGEKFTSESKQKIAKELGLSETTFVSPSTIATFKLDFFTPMRQIAHCGHATIATFAYLKKLGLLGDALDVSKETIDGVRQIRLKDGEVFMEQKAPVIDEPDAADFEWIKKSLGLSGKQAYESLSLVYTGNRFLVVKLPDVKSIRALQPDLALISAISHKYNLIGYYVFCQSSEPQFDATTRMFAPAYGITEESATGMAAGPLAAYLYHLGQEKENYIFEQGRYMEKPSPSLIKVDLKVIDNHIVSLYAGGSATFLEKRIINLN